MKYKILFTLFSLLYNNYLIIYQLIKSVLLQYYYFIFIYFIFFFELLNFFNLIIFLIDYIKFNF